ncbi:MAG: ornithine cyclodeaminase family protein, partial [Candidatus Hadarchaeales archaeon]
LARKNSRVVGFVGAGVQAMTQLEALAHVFEIEEAKVNDISIERSEKFAREMGKKVGIKIKVERDTKTAVEGADIVITTTPSRKPIVFDRWISPGVHINAIGADAPGKQELDPKILKRAKVVVDDIQQAIHSGEVNVPLSTGEIARGDIYGDLGEIVTGKKPGRTSNDEITLFDSTGLAVQDIATDWVVYKKALKMKVGRKIDLFS